jgi:hypothetical protein
MTMSARMGVAATSPIHGSHVLRVADQSGMRAPDLHPLELGVEPGLPALALGWFR